MLARDLLLRDTEAGHCPYEGLWGARAGGRPMLAMKNA